MTEQMATVLARQLVQLSPKHKSRESSIQYGLELMISSGIVLILMQIVSIAFRMPFSWIWFALGFAPLRSTAGGYHATSHLRCYVISSGLFAFVLIVEKYTNLHECILVYLSSVALILVMRYAPVEAANKRLSKKRKKSNRNKSLVLASIALIVSILVCYTGKKNDGVVLYLLGTTAASGSLVIARKKTRREE